MKRLVTSLAAIAAALAFTGCLDGESTAPTDEYHETIDPADLGDAIVTRLDTGEQVDLSALPADATIELGDAYAPVAESAPLSLAHCANRESWETYPDEWVPHYGQICFGGSCFSIVYNILEDVECWRMCVGTCKTCYTFGASNHMPHTIAPHDFPDGNPSSVIFGEVCNEFDPFDPFEL
jgi:hypothetical protein